MWTKWAKWFLSINILQKGVHFFLASWPVSPYPARLKQKRNTFCENWNVLYNQITYHILQIKVFQIIAIKFNHFRNNNYLLRKFRNHQKKSVALTATTTAKISHLDNFFSQNCRAILNLVGNSSWCTRYSSSFTKLHLAPKYENTQLLRDALHG